MAPAEPNAKPFEVQGELPVFAEERKGWKGYVEWERYPEKKKQAAEILARYDFPVVSEITTMNTTCSSDSRATATRVSIGTIT